MGHPLQQYYSRIYRTYDRVNALFTMGLDKKWRFITVKECLASAPLKVLDLCCGTGDLAVLIKTNATYGVKVTGYDLNPEMLEMAGKKALKENASVEFIRGNAASMPFSDHEFDCITIGFGFRNLTWENPDRDRHIQEIARILKPGGRLLILESSKPDNTFIRFFYSLYLRAVLVPLGGLLSGEWDAYRYLAGSSSGFYNFDELGLLLSRFGFELNLKKRFFFGSANLLEACKTSM